MDCNLSMLLCIFVLLLDVQLVLCTVSIDSKEMLPTENQELVTLSTMSSVSTAEDTTSPSPATLSPQPPSEPTRCFELIEQFSRTASEFTNCSILYSRPVRFCEHCIEQYMSAVHSYNLFMESSVEGEDNTFCSDLIFLSDRIQIIRQTYLFIVNTWDQGYCDTCFYVLVNSTSPELSKGTKKFMELANNTNICFQKYAEVGCDEPFVQKNITVDPAVCSNCSQHYNTLNEFYNTLLDEHQGHMCVDLVDIMNCTRLLWSKTFTCSRHQVDNIPIILLSMLFCSLPILFYSANKIHGTKVEKKLLKQKRLRESRQNSLEDDQEELET